VLVTFETRPKYPQWRTGWRLSWQHVEELKASWPEPKPYAPRRRTRLGEERAAMFAGSELARKALDALGL
jgi:hypothetical protein